MTRAEAIDILKNTIVRFGRTNGKVAYVEALQIAIKALEEPHWIPCSERLPEEGREVLACLTDWKTGEQKKSCFVSNRFQHVAWIWQIQRKVCSMDAIARML